jgi:hypothetical protein
MFVPAAWAILLLSPLGLAICVAPARTKFGELAAEFGVLFVEI